MADAIIQEFAISGTFLGMLAAAYFYPYAFMQIPSGLLSDKFSPRKILASSMFLASIGTFIFALAPTPAVALLGRVFIGFAVSIVLLPSYKALANWFTAKSFVVVMAAIMAIPGGLGGAFTGAPLAFLIEKFGWRATSCSLAILCLCLVFLIIFFFKDSPEEMNLPLPEAKVKEAIENTVEKISTFQGILTLIKLKNYWYICIAFFSSSALLFSFSGLWAGLFFTHVCGLTREQMGSIISVSFIVAAIAPVLFASLTTKIPSYKKLLIFYSIIFLATTSWLFCRFAMWGYYEAYMWGLLFTIVLSTPPAFYFSAIRQIAPANIKGTATGLVYFFPMIGGAIYQPLIGYIVDSLGFVDTLTKEMFYYVALLYLVTSICSFICILLLREKNNIILSE